MRTKFFMQSKSFGYIETTKSEQRELVVRFETPKFVDWKKETDKEGSPTNSTMSSLRVGNLSMFKSTSLQHDISSVRLTEDLTPAEPYG